MEEHASQFITVRISYLEIHNEIIYDLLANTASDIPLSVIEGPQGVCVKGLSVHAAPQEEVALNLMFEVGRMDKT